MPARFELKTAANGQIHFNLKATNGQVILSSEMYKTRASAMNGIESVMKNSPLAERYERKTSANGKFFFVLKAANHQVIGTSEMYETEKARDNGIESVKKNGAGASIADTTAAGR